MTKKNYLCTHSNRIMKTDFAEINEKEIFDTATEKLDLYAPICIKYDQPDQAAEFLKPGGEYVRFAVKEFIKELLGELIKPVGEWATDSKYYIDMEPVFNTVSSLLPKHFDVQHGLIGYIFSEYVSVTISDILSLHLLRGHHAFQVVGIRVDGFWDDDEMYWMGTVAEETDDEYLAHAANGDVEVCSALFFPDQTEEFCHVAEYLYASHARHREMAETKAKMLREKYNLT